MSNELRVSLGLDSLANYMGQFTLDSSICANSTVNIGATAEEVVNKGNPNDEVVNIETPIKKELNTVDEMVNKTEVVAEGNITKELGGEEAILTLEAQTEQHLPEPPLPPPPGEDNLNEFAYEDVEMMSIVLESGAELDYSNVPLPEDAEEAFPDPPPPAEEKQLPQPPETEPLVEDKVINVVEEKEPEREDPANQTCHMDVDECSPTQTEAPTTDYVHEEQQKPVEITPAIESPCLTEIPLPREQPVPVEVQEVSTVDEPNPTVTKAKSMDMARMSSDFKMPGTVLRKSLSNQGQTFGSNPFDVASAGTVDHKQEGE